MAAKGDFYSEKKKRRWGHARPRCLEQQVSPVFDERAGITNLKSLFVLVFWGEKKVRNDQIQRGYQIFFSFSAPLLPSDLTSQHAGGVMDGSGYRTESTAATDGSPRSDRTRTSVGGRAAPLGTCAFDRYSTAKFSLAAYLLCWLVLRWYQVRTTSEKHFGFLVQTFIKDGFFFSAFKDWTLKIIWTFIRLYWKIKVSAKSWKEKVWDLFSQPIDHIATSPMPGFFHGFCTQSQSLNFLCWPAAPTLLLNCEGEKGAQLTKLASYLNN